MDDGKLDALGQTIVSALGGAASAHAVAFNQLTVTVEAGRIVDVMKYLRDDPERGFALGFSTTQLLSLCIVPVAAVLYSLLRKPAPLSGRATR